MEAIKKEQIYLDLSKLSGEEIKEVFQILKDAKEPVYSFEPLPLNTMKFVLSFCENKIWSRSILNPYNKTEISLSEFRQLFSDYPGKDYQELFDHLHNEHGLTLLESEMSEIIRIVSKGEEVLQVDIYSGELNTERILTYKKLSEKYNIQESTVRDIFNAGAEWVINFKSNQ